MTRDSQRQKVYDAEYLLRRAFDQANQTPSRSYDFFGSKLTLPEERRFGTVENVQNYVDRVLSLGWVYFTYTQARCDVRVFERKGQAEAHYQHDEIHVPILSTWALREIVVLHEIAHHLTPLDPGHGSQFVGVLYTLLSEIVGPEAGLLYQWACSENDVKLALQTS